MVRIGLLVVVVALIAVVFVALRPDVEAVSRVDAEVTIVCAAFATTEIEPCRSRGDELLEGGAPSTTFEAEDVVRVRLDRSGFGLGATCTAEWFLGRYPDEAVWSEETACP